MTYRCFTKASYFPTYRALTAKRDDTLLLAKMKHLFLSTASLFQGLLCMLVLTIIQALLLLQDMFCIYVSVK